MTELTARPRARARGLIVRSVEQETLVYDLDTREALCLDPTLATVWSRCDGASSLDEIGRLVAPKEQRAVSRDLAWIAVEQLRSKGLLLEESLGAPSDNRFHGLSRREMIRRSGLIGIAVPTLLTMMASPAAAAASAVCNCSAPNGSGARPEGCPCQGNSDCCAVCGGSEANPICGGVIKPSAPACCAGADICGCDAPGGSGARPAGCPCEGNADCCAVCGGSEANPICGGVIKPSAPGCCATASMCGCDAPSGSGARPAGCPCEGNADCCAVCGGSEANPICGGVVKPAAPACCT